MWIGLVCNLASLASVVAAGVLCYGGKEGWGGFLLIAVLTHATYKTTD